MANCTLLARKLKKANISKIRYETENKALETLGYSEYQRERIILRPYSENSVACLITLHEKLAEHFNHQQLTRLVEHDGGSNNLEAVNQSFKSLKALGLTTEHIVKIAGHHGGSKNIEAVSKSFKDLQALGLTAEHIVKIAGHDGGSHNIEAVRKSFKDLKALGLTAEHIVKIAGHGGGSKNIEAVSKSFDALKALGLTAEHIVKIAGNIGGSKNIEAVSKSFKALKALGLTAEHIVKIAGHNGGSKNITAVSQSFDALKTLGLTAEHIVKIAGHDGGSNNIALIRENYAKLIAAPVNWSELANLFNKPGKASRRLFLETVDSLSISAAKEHQTAGCSEPMMFSHSSKKRRWDEDRSGSEQNNLSKRNPDSGYSLVSNSLFATSKRRKISVSELLNPENTMNTPLSQNN